MCRRDNIVRECNGLLYLKANDMCSVMNFVGYDYKTERSVELEEGFGSGQFAEPEEVA